MPERETVIKFVISGPFLNAEAAHTQWSAEQPPMPALEELLRRIADLERKLDEERALVELLSSRIPRRAGARTPPPPPAPARRARPTRPPRYPSPRPGRPRAVETAAEPEQRRSRRPAPPPLSTVARTPPPKVRGLRRMIGALRHL